MMDSLFTSIYGVLSHYNLVEEQPFASSVAHLSSRDRESLAQEVASEIINQQEMESSLAELDVTLEQCRVSLEAFHKKERFLGVRLNRYRMLMDRREDRMSDLMNKLQSQLDTNDSALFSDDDDLENENVDNTRNQLKFLQYKHATDQKCLQSVENLHKDIIVQVEIFRRRINDLEEKQQDLFVKRDECQEFLIAAAEYA